MTGYVMDTSAWIEVFRGSEKGKKITEYIFPELIEIASLITPSIVITEMKSIYIRSGEGDKFEYDLEKIRNLSEIEDKIKEHCAIIAGKIHGENHSRRIQISYVDCILWTLAREWNMKVLSTDKHFKECPQAIYITEGEDNEI